MTQPPGDAPSPYLSLRQAVRPAIFAYSLLASEQGQAGTLAEESGRLVQATRELLEAAGLVRLLSPEGGPDVPGDDSGRPGRLLAAYASAGLMWARVVGSVLALADALLDQARWDDARRLAGLLSDAGEISAAQDIGCRVNDAIWAQHGKRIGRMHDRMSPREVREGIDALRNAFRGLSEDVQERSEGINSSLVALAASIVAIIESENHAGRPLSRLLRSARSIFRTAEPQEYAYAYFIAEGKGLGTPDLVESDLARLSAIFYACQAGKESYGRG